jgi:hypothetical protein
VEEPVTGAHREPPGSVAEEAARLLAALQERVGPVRRDDGADAAGECRYCPVCQALAAVRTTNPEVTEHLAAAAAELVDAWRAARTSRSPRESAAPAEGSPARASDVAGDPADGPGEDAPAAGEAPSRRQGHGDGAPPRRQGHGVQHIDVR